MPIIEVRHVSKEYRLGQLQSLRHGLARLRARLGGRTVEPLVPFKALDDVDFQIEPGEVVGIIGTNGAGKSTLLKALSRIIVPTRGSVAVRGSVAPLIEVGAGLIGDLTGRENIYLNGSILGIPKATLRKKFDEIVAFAELEAFIDTPIKRYSSGMAIRLAFSVATSADADILIVDEVLAVGDLAFQRKCFDRMENLIKRDGKTVLLVSHDIRQVERMCHRTLLMDHGRIILDGPSKDVCDQFYRRSDEKIKHLSASAAQAAGGRRESSGEVELVELAMFDAADNPIRTVPHQGDLTVRLTFKSHKELVRPVFGLGVHTTDLLYLATEQSDTDLAGLRLPPGTFTVACRIRRFPLTPGVYSWRVGVALGELFSAAFYAENVLHFDVSPAGQRKAGAAREGFIELDTRWAIEQDQRTQAAPMQRAI